MASAKAGMRLMIQLAAAHDLAVLPLHDGTSAARRHIQATSACREHYVTAAKAHH
jgi:hypothetical protein